MIKKFIFILTLSFLNNLISSDFSKERKISYQEEQKLKRRKITVP